MAAIRATGLQGTDDVPGGNGLWYMWAVHDYQRLDVWAAARRLAADCYASTRFFPDDETFGLQAQIRRSSISIASNIAEGAGRGSPADFRRFVRIASGSACELETQLIIAADVSLLAPADAKRLLAVVTRIKEMLHALEQSLTRRSPQPGS